jgi:hypothetical protein
MTKEEYIEEEKKVKAQGWLEPGMKVVVTRKAKNEEDGWTQDWHPNMNSFIGKTAKILKEGDKVGGTAIRGWDPDGAGFPLLHPDKDTYEYFPFFILTPTAAYSTTTLKPDKKGVLVDKYYDCNSDGTLKYKSGGFEFL